MTVEETIKEIRGHLRKTMNGVTSTVMRQSGYTYKMNFGSPIHKVNKIAALYQPNVELAETLWQMDVRELKLLATSLYPLEAFTEEKACQWIESTPYIEIARPLVAHLISKKPYAEHLAVIYMQHLAPVQQAAGFLLVAHLSMAKRKITDDTVKVLFEQAHQVMTNGLSILQSCASLALKRYARLEDTDTKGLLETFSDFSESDSPVWQEIYNDLKFDIDYFQ
ncbi:MAG: hypothetical protein M0P33_02355 [Massilibacteroides sp.]|nr:hypothetical protein [Massilibacteroides sp.]